MEAKDIDYKIVLPTLRALYWRMFFFRWIKFV